MVRLGSAIRPGSDAAVFLVREAGKILAASVDCNGIYCRQNPREGAKLAVAEAARNLACAGAIPLAVTDNLNFGNPYDSKNFLQLREAVEGLAEACRAFNIPVTGGNVSLYNENPAGPIDPTPTVGMVGLIADPKHITSQFFKQAGDVILLIGGLGSELGASHFLKVVHDRKTGTPPRVDLEQEKRTHAALGAVIRMGLVQSAHDCSEGGLAVALAEACLSGPTAFGADIDFGSTGLRPDVLLFNESQSRVIISVQRINAAATLALLDWRGVPARRMGSVAKSDSLRISADGDTCAWSLRELDESWSQSIEKLMGEKSGGLPETK
jgi:phosphoribosylformylglycinamidine synthase